VRARMDQSGFIWDGLTGHVMSSVLADEKVVKEYSTRAVTTWLE